MVNVCSPASKTTECAYLPGPAVPVSVSPANSEIVPPVPSPVENLVEQLVDQTGRVTVSDQRLHHLMRANMQVNTEIARGPTFPLISRRVLRAASELVEAGYGVLAVYDADGQPRRTLPCRRRPGDGRGDG